MNKVEQQSIKQLMQASKSPDSGIKFSVLCDMRGIRYFLIMGALKSFNVKQSARRRRGIDRLENMRNLNRNREEK